jgi:hypothetical protein
MFAGVTNLRLPSEILRRAQQRAPVTEPFEKAIFGENRSSPFLAALEGSAKGKQSGANQRDACRLRGGGTTAK